MSPLLIGGLLAAGLLVLVSIGFISHGLERARLERARQSAEVSARIKIGNSVMASLPGQFLPAELGTLLLQIEVQLLEKLARINKNAGDVSQRLAASRAQLEQNQVPSNAPVTLDSEAKGKEARIQLENLYKQLQQAQADGLIDKATLTHWSSQIRRFLVAANLDTFNATAKQGMQQGKPRVAKLQYERAIAYLTKLNNPAFSEHLKQYKALLQRAEAAVVAQDQSASGQPSELDAGLQQMESADDQWKKNAVYDD
ncbi:hypothetical protein [Halopseudomonas sabulinigri]|uniref:DNA repair protein n=1 Tax=Halopseudomonas sabulinigri TaxID=472181 RepID=A0A1H1NL05_9GAMM|nr:hypothetical protein [Halopseudomonas sabulinigri]SDR99696.1 hypothetical protein SAMN05216271_0917 [Halopseudomonas sabulinigri]